MQQHLRVVPDFAIKNDPQCCFLLTFPLNTAGFGAIQSCRRNERLRHKIIFKAALKRFGFYSSRTSVERRGLD